MDPSGTPALTGNQFDDYLLSITRWNLSLRKLIISAGASPDIVLALVYRLIPHVKLCQKILKCLETHLELRE